LPVSSVTSLKLLPSDVRFYGWEGKGREGSKREGVELKKKS